MPAAIENEPKVVNMDMNDAPIVSAVSSASCFVLSASSPSGEIVGVSRCTTRSVSGAPLSVPPVLDDEHGPDQARLVEQSLRRGERHQHARAVGAAAVVVDDRLHPARMRPCRPTKMRISVAGARVELVRRLRVQVDLAGAQVGRARRSCRGS